MIGRLKRKQIIIDVVMGIFRNMFAKGPLDSGKESPRNARAEKPTIDHPDQTSVQPAWDQIDLVAPAAQKDALKQYTATAGAATQPRFATVSADLNTAFQNALIGVASGSVKVDDALASLQAVVDKQK